MTQNEIIEIAGQHFCRIEYGNGNVHEGYEFSFEELEAFAKLVAAKAIAELESQEPVAWQVHPFDYGIGHEGVYARTDRPEQVKAWKRKGWNAQPLYTHPPQRTWQGLTDEEITKIVNANSSKGLYLMAKGIEAKLKEKNT
jgi:hypothetical protein